MVGNIDGELLREAGWTSPSDGEISGQAVDTDAINTEKWVDPADGTDGIQAAIDEGVKINLKQGEYTGPGVTIDATPLVIEATGWQSDNGNGGSVIRPSSPITWDQDPGTWDSVGAKVGTVRDVEFDGANLSAGDNLLELAQDTAFWDFQRCYVHDAPQDNVHGVRVYHIEFHKCYNAGAGRDGYWFDRDASSISSHVTIRGGWASQCGRDGIHSEYCTNLTVDSVGTVQNTQRGIYHDEGALPTIISGDCENNGTAVKIGSGGVFRPTPVNILGLHMFSNSTGLVLNGGDDINVIGLSANDTTNKAIDYSGLATGATVTEFGTIVRDGSVDRGSCWVFGPSDVGGLAVEQGRSLVAAKGDGNRPAVLKTQSGDDTVVHQDLSGANYLKADAANNRTDLLNDGNLRVRMLSNGEFQFFDESLNTVASLDSAGNLTLSGSLTENGSP